jgi:DNA-binding IclR family transcriptional regulator
MAEKYNLIQSVIRATTLLEHIAREGHQMGISQISRNVGLHKSTCFGILYTLESLGYVIRDEEGRYSLTARVCDLSDGYLRNVDLRQIALPYLMDLRNITKETVHLVIREGNHAVYIDKIDGPHKMSIVSQIGARAEIHCTGVGKVILAYMDDKDRDEALTAKMTAFTPYTITSPKVLRKYLKTIRECGYSIDNQELEEGLCCLAAPLFGPANTICGAVSISGPSTRFTEKRLDQLIPHIVDTARLISSHIDNRHPGLEKKANRTFEPCGRRQQPNDERFCRALHGYRLHNPVFIKGAKNFTNLARFIFMMDSSNFSHCSHFSHSSKLFHFSEFPYNLSQKSSLRIESMHGQGRINSPGYSSFSPRSETFTCSIVSKGSS